MRVRGCVKVGLQYDTRRRRLPGALYVKLSWQVSNPDAGLLSHLIHVRAHSNLLRRKL